MADYDKPFDKAEYAKRVADTKKRMQAAGFDLILCQDPANMCWLTGFRRLVVLRAAMRAGACGRGMADLVRPRPGRQVRARHHRPAGQQHRAVLRTPGAAQGRAPL